jgi:hypothetical protein
VTPKKFKFLVSFRNLAMCFGKKGNVATEISLFVFAQKKTPVRPSISSLHSAGAPSAMAMRSLSEDCYKSFF